MHHSANIVRRGIAFAALAAGSVVITFACAEPNRPAAPGTAPGAPAGVAKSVVDPLNPQGNISGSSSVYPLSSAATSQTTTGTPASTIGLNGSFTVSSDMGETVSHSLRCSLPATASCSSYGFAAGGPACDGITRSISGSVQASHYAVWLTTQASYYSQSTDSYTCPPPPPPPAPLTAGSASDWEDACVYFSDGTSECVQGWDPTPVAAPAVSGYNVLASRASQSLAAGGSQNNDGVTVVASGRIDHSAPAIILRRPNIEPHDVVVIDTTRAHPEDLAGALFAIASLRSLDGPVPAHSVEGDVTAKYLGVGWHKGARANALATLLALRSAPERLVTGMGQLHALDLPAIPRGVTRLRPGQVP